MQPQNAESRDQRKHIRIEHSGTVQLLGEGRRFSGQAVNISRTGMQVVVNLPDSYESVRSITFTLPNSEHTIELPCRIVRSQASNGNTHPDVLGLEFSYQGEAQLLLIENYIREMKQGQLYTSDIRADMRMIPRTRCNITDVGTSRADLEVFSIDNISADGLLVSFKGDLQPHESISLSFILPNDSRSIELNGRVMYVIENRFQQRAIAGIRLIDTGAINEARIRNFVITSRSSYAFKDLCDHFSQAGTNGQLKISDQTKISNLLHHLAERRIPVNVLASTSLRIYELTIEKVTKDLGTFAVGNIGTLDRTSFADYSTTYCSFVLRGGSYFFKTTASVSGFNGVCFMIPESIFHSEKRSYQRKFIEFSSDVRLCILDPKAELEPLSGRLVDISRRGFLCEVTVPRGSLSAVAPGHFVTYELDSSLDLGLEGEIRHIKEVAGHNGSIVLHLGIEAGIKRGQFKFNKIGLTDGNNGNELKPKLNVKTNLCTKSIPLTFYNSRNQPMRGLLNTTRLHARAPVVIIPPAFGKKKEALSPFVTTLLLNFALKDKYITVLRYDGINRPGESYSESKCRKRGYEMLHYRVSQGLEDLQASLEFVGNNPYFEPTEVVLLTFSMSAIDARKFLCSYDSRKYNIKLWISCMGVACAQSTIGNILAGIDIISNFKMGIPNGIHGMLGHILDMDQVAKDLVNKKYAYMTDARHDMAKIGIPVLWMYGQHDKWVKADEVRDIMSVDARAPREVLELATGHNLRTSEEAIQTFKIITNHVYQNLYGQPIQAIDPPKDEIMRQISYERERLESVDTFENRDYWRGYLMGDCQQSSGYDFYRNLREFRDFLSHEVQLLAVENGNRIADMGCGTGLLLEALLNQSSSNGHFHLDIEAVELVPEALEKTRKKCESILSGNGKLDHVRIQYRLLDLEPNRLLPVRNFMMDSRLDLNYLRNRIAGLRNTLIDDLVDIHSPELDWIVRGAALSPERLDLIREIGKRELQTAVLELNRAARFLRRNLSRDDLAAQSATTVNAGEYSLDYHTLTTADLQFELLDFGNFGLDCNNVFPGESFDRIIASLLLPYLFNGDYLFSEFQRILKPGGLLLVSSMKPDSDLSTIFTNYTRDVESLAQSSLTPGQMNTSLKQARSMLNEAANLFELEEDGYFHFYSADELVKLFERYNFSDIRTSLSLGNPAQAIIVTGRKASSE